MAKRLAGFLAPGLAVLVAGAGFGGWAVVTVEDLPDHGVAGRPLVLEFVVRQHGVTLLDGLRPRIEARSGDKVITAAAVSVNRPGRYAGSVILPEPGHWTITIHSGFGTSKTTLMPIEVVAPGGTPSRVAADAERGQRLFVAKGCASCHVHHDVNATVIADIGPELTLKRYQLDYLRQFLANPAMAVSNRNGPTMPNLGLKESEIAALAAFLNAERRVTSAQ